MDKGKKGHSKLIIACSAPAENFKFIEETLNQMAFLIGVEIAEPRLDHITFGWDRIRCSLLCDVSANGICSVCFITQNVASGNFHFRTFGLYPQIAAKFDTTASRVERGIRHLIEVTWTRADMDILCGYFGNTVSPDRGKPTNGEFITRIANVVRQRMREAA